MSGEKTTKWGIWTVSMALLVGSLAPMNLACDSEQTSYRSGGEDDPEGVSEDDGGDTGGFDLRRALGRKKKKKKKKKKNKAPPPMVDDFGRGGEEPFPPPFFEPEPFPPLNVPPPAPAPLPPPPVVAVPPPAPVPTPPPADQGKGTPATPTPPSKATTVTSYIRDIKPIMEQYCVACHRAGRADDGVAVDTYEQLVLNYNASRNAVLTNRMPLAGPLPDNVKQILSTWGSEGFPQ